MSRSLTRRTTQQTNAASAMAAYTAAARAAEWACPESTMTVVIAPGPASIGMASGVMATSSFSCPSTISAVVSCVVRCDRSMSIAISQRMPPPAMRNAASVMPR